MSEEPLPPYAVIDIDGVLADVRHRLHFVESRPKNWEAFFAAADEDPALPEGLEVARTLGAGHDLVYLSGRPERLRATTAAWFHAHHLPPGRLLLRADNDRRPSRVLKLDVLRRLAARRTVSVVVDDDASVCAAARAAGFEVFEATWGGGTQPSLFAAQEGDGRT